MRGGEYVVYHLFAGLDEAVEQSSHLVLRLLASALGAELPHLLPPLPHKTAQHRQSALSVSVGRWNRSQQLLPLSAVLFFLFLVFILPPCCFIRLLKLTHPQTISSETEKYHTTTKKSKKWLRSAVVGGNKGKERRRESLQQWMARGPAG